MMRVAAIAYPPFRIEKGLSQKVNLRKAHFESSNFRTKLQRNSSLGRIAQKEKGKQGTRYRKPIKGPYGIVRGSSDANFRKTRFQPHVFPLHPELFEIESQTKEEHLRADILRRLGASAGTKSCKVPGTEGIEMNSDLVLEQDGSLERKAEAIVRRCEALIEQGRTPRVYTRRTLLTVPDDTPEKALKRSALISEAVQSLVGGLGVTPAFVVAKGGITSSDVGTKALRFRRARAGADPSGHSGLADRRGKPFPRRGVCHLSRKRRNGSHAAGDR